MNLYVVMAMLLAMGLDVNEGKPGDCDYSDTAGMTNCQFFCGFMSGWSQCENNICCCGGGNKWSAFRYEEGEVCSGDTPTTPPPWIVCDPNKCETACGDVKYHCFQSCCLCGMIAEDSTHTWKLKYCSNNNKD